MECEEDYSIFSEDVRRELRTAHVRANEDEHMTNSEYSSEGVLKRSRFSGEILDLISRVCSILITLLDTISSLFCE